MSNKAVGIDFDIMEVAEVYELPDGPARHQDERTSGKFQDVDICAHGFQDVFQVPLPHRCIVRAAYLCYTLLAGLAFETKELGERRMAQADDVNATEGMMSDLVDVVHRIWIHEIHLLRRGEASSGNN